MESNVYNEDLYRSLPQGTLSSLPTATIRRCFANEDSKYWEALRKQNVDQRTSG